MINLIPKTALWAVSAQREQTMQATKEMKGPLMTMEKLSSPIAELELSG